MSGFRCILIQTTLYQFDKASLVISPSISVLPCGSLRGCYDNSIGNNPWTSQNQICSTERSHSVTEEVLLAKSLKGGVQQHPQAPRKSSTSSRHEIQRSANDLLIISYEPKPQASNKMNRNSLKLRASSPRYDSHGVCASPHDRSNRDMVIYEPLIPKP